MLRRFLQLFAVFAIFFSRDALSYLTTPVQETNLEESNSENSVKYYLFTRSSPSTGIELEMGNLKGLQDSEYCTCMPTLIVTHGWGLTYLGPSVQNIVAAALEFLEVNIIAVDWSSYASDSNYFAVVPKAPEVGQNVALFVRFLIDEGTSPDNVHLIGHNLGAHVFGFAGKTLNDFNLKIYRISGLDPSSPAVSRLPNERLASTDAQFVDIIHTDGGAEGILLAIGTADYYPNGGVPIQPGCGLVSFNECSHSRSYMYFAESINRMHHFYACPCVEVIHGVPIGCSTTCNAQMGYFASPRDTGSYFLLTNATPPYSLD